ncbi:MAG: hypothetical protein ACOZQL_17225 [Myxococcota bacterium]
MAPRTYTVVTSVQDPLSSERLVEVLREEGLDAFSRAGGAASTSPFGAAAPPFWEIFVPSESLAKAEALARAELEQVERDAAANAQAAEEEALSGENPTGG